MGNIKNLSTTNNAKMILNYRVNSGKLQLQKQNHLQHEKFLGNIKHSMLIQNDVCSV